MRSSLQEGMKAMPEQTVPEISESASLSGNGSMRELALFLLRLGTTAFGGPAAHIALREDELVLPYRGNALGLTHGPARVVQVSARPRAHAILGTLFLLSAASGVHASSPHRWKWLGSGELRFR